MKVEETKDNIAALAEPVMEEGVHILTYAVTGDVIVGIAGEQLDQWEAPAVGFGTETGCLVRSRTTTDEGMPAYELFDQRMEGDVAERLVHMELDCDQSTFRVRLDDTVWRNVPFRLPGGAVRPWVLVPATSLADVAPSARLLSCVIQPAALQRVRGLEGVVGHLGSAAQRRALHWCEGEGLYEAQAIEAVGATHDFVEALGVRSDEAHGVIRRLTGSFRLQ